MGWVTGYRRDAAAAFAADDGPDFPAVGAAHFAAANINPMTGLATDYLNTFNEAIMLLEMLSSTPEFRGDFLSWRPASYREHFATSHYNMRSAAIAAYDSANPRSRARLDELAGTMTAMLETTRAVLDADLPPGAAGVLAGDVAAALKPLVARAGAVINGETELDDTRTPQAAVDDLMNA